ncbi:MAG: hypothetical protein C0399_03385 [Syntrophus sp. (in: bacteria)]|nr:hypothetical protein [Syntrophus sp. (in: bacteria)]
MYMSNVDDNLKENERVTYRTGLHWVIFGGPLVLLCVAGLSIPSKGMPAVILLIVATIWTLFVTRNLQMTEFVITDKRILIQRWFTLKKFYDISISEIVDVEIYQPALGKLLNFGKIIVHLPKKKRVSFRLVNAPVIFLMKFQEEFLKIHKELQQEKP